MGYIYNHPKVDNTIPECDAEALDRAFEESGYSIEEPVLCSFDINPIVLFGQNTFCPSEPDDHQADEGYDIALTNISNDLSLNIQDISIDRKKVNVTLNWLLGICGCGIC